MTEGGGSGRDRPVPGRIGCLGHYRPMHQRGLRDIAAMTRIAAVIPARMASSRFPGKPLLEIEGLPMVEHVRRRASLCRGFSEVAVATCDRPIAEMVEREGGKVIMTSPYHPGATDRVAEAMQALNCTHVVNVQGDEILVLPEDLEKMTQKIAANPSLPAWNAIAPLEEGEAADRSIVKCAVSLSERILFCGRDFSAWPAPAPAQRGGPFRKILGILAYRRDFLERYSTLSQTPLEKLESIDQCRILELDALLQGVEFSAGYPGINEPREVKAVERWLREDPQQQRVLEEILGRRPSLR